MSAADKSPWRNSTFTLSSRGRLGTFGDVGSSRDQPLAAYTNKPTPECTTAHETLPPDRDLLEGLAKEPLRTIAIPSASEEEDLKVANCQYIGSYNWTDRETPTIIIPGSPPQWQNRNPPYNVRPDVGVQFNDLNGYKMPKSPLLPLITAVNVHANTDGQANFDWSTIDFVTDRNGLRKLMRWVAGHGKNVRDFRIDLQLAGNRTILMNRWEKRTREGYSGRTFGFNFERASTVPAHGCRESLGHHRIVTYDLNGLKMVVRFEVDACIPPAKTYRKRLPSVDELTTSLASVEITSNAESESGPEPHPLRVINAGREVPASAIIELTTRSGAKQYEFEWTDAFPQLFFSQTTHHFMGIHSRGRFTTINKRKLFSPEMQTIGQGLQPQFKALRRTLDIIKELVTEHGQRGRLTLICKDGILGVYGRTDQDSCLPDNLMSLFD